MDPKKLSIFLVLLTIVSVALYITSLFLPAIEYVSKGYESAPPSSCPGWQILLFGWYGLAGGLPWWLCNLAYPILFILAWLRKLKACTITACILSLIAMGSFTSIGVELYIPDNEYDRIVSLGPAFYFWIASFAIWILAYVPKRIARKSV